MEEKTKEKKYIKLSLGGFFFMLLVILAIGFLGVNVYLQHIGVANIFDLIRNENEVVATEEIEPEEYEVEEDVFVVNPELRDVIKFAIIEDEDEYNTIIAVTADGNEIELVEIDEVSRFRIAMDYYEGKLYVVVSNLLPNWEATYTYMYIDLNNGDGNYELTVIGEETRDASETERGIQSDITAIAVIDGNIFSARGADTVMRKFNIDSDEFSDTNISINVHEEYRRIISIYRVTDMEDTLIFNDARNIYMRNIHEEENILIATDSHIELYNDNKIIFSRQLGNHEYVYYEFNALTNRTRRISEPMMSGGGTIGVSKIIPQEAGYIFVEGSTVYRYVNGQVEELYTCEKTWPFYIRLLSSDRLNVFRIIRDEGDYMEAEDMEDYEKNIVIDLETGEIEEFETLRNAYSKVFVSIR